MASDFVTAENEEESDLPSVSSCPELSSSTRGLSPSLLVQVRAVEEATNVGQGEKVKGTRQVDYIDISGDDVTFGRSSPTPRYSLILCPVREAEEVRVWAQQDTAAAVLSLLWGTVVQVRNSLEMARR